MKTNRLHTIHTEASKPFGAKHLTPVYCPEDSYENGLWTGTKRYAH